MVERRYRALLIGNCRFPRDPARLPPLEGPPNDLHLLKEALVDRDTGLHQRAAVQVCRDHGREAVSRRIRRFLEEARRDDQLLLYYSGHGRRDHRNRLFLCVRDTTVEDLPATALAAADVLERIQESPASTKVVILDCCHAGAFTRRAMGDGVYLLGSARASELAQDAGPRGASPFTAAVAEVLRAGAPTGEEFLTFHRLYEFVHDRLADARSSPPVESIIQGAGDAHLARRPSTRGAIRRLPRRRPPPPAGEPLAPGLPVPLPVREESVRLGRDLVTNSQFAMFLDDPVNAGWRRDGSGGAAASRSSSYLRHWRAGSLPDGQRDHPVVYVSPAAAAAFCEWAGRRVGIRLRLPYWHEWAQAARAGRNSDAWLREELTAGRVNCRSTMRALAPVGTLAPNPYGFRDLLGNAFDLCLDPDRSGQVLCCGGAFDTPEGLLLSPEPIAPYECRANVGFRYAVELEPERG